MNDNRAQRWEQWQGNGNGKIDSNDKINSNDKIKIKGNGKDAGVSPLRFASVEMTIYLGLGRENRRRYG